MKFLNIIIFSDNKPEYLIMKEYLRGYLRQFVNVKYYFVSTDDKKPFNSINNSVPDELIIGGIEESLVPGILSKTVKAIYSLKIIDPEYEYDYLIRSNISTVIDFNRLEKNIIDYGDVVGYGGGYGEILQWIDKPGGIVDKTYWGTPFIQGTNIIMSRLATECYLEDYMNDSPDIDISIVDDVSIGIYFKKKYKNRRVIIINGFNFIDSNNYQKTDIYDNNINWCFRHKTNNRQFDLIAMENTIKCLTKILKIEKL
jgi:hypothetical protein